MRKERFRKKKEETGFLLLGFIWNSFTAWQEAETGTKHAEKNIGRLVQASVTVQLWCESTCCVCTPTDTPPASFTAFPWPYTYSSLNASHNLMALQLCCFFLFMQPSISLASYPEAPVSPEELALWISTCYRMTSIKWLFKKISRLTDYSTVDVSPCKAQNLATQQKYSKVAQYARYAPFPSGENGRRANCRSDRPPERVCTVLLKGCKNLYELESEGEAPLAQFSGVSMSIGFWPCWSALFLRLCFIIRRSCLSCSTKNVKTASELLYPALPSFPDSSKSTFMFPLVLATVFEAPFSLFLPPFSLLSSLPDKKKRRETGFCSKQQESFVALISICKWRLTKVQTSLCDNSTAWPNLNEIYKIYLYK